MPGSDADIIIRVGAAADDSYRTFFNSVPRTAARARTQVERETRAQAKTQESIYRQNQRIEERATAGVAREAEKRARAQERALQYVQRVRTRHFEQLQRDEEKAARDSAKKAQRAADSRGREAYRLAQRGAGFVQSGIGALGRGAIGLGTQIAGGSGIQFDIGSHIGNSVDLRKAATRLSNSGFQEGKAGPAGIRQDPRQIAANIKQAADDAGLARGEVAGGLDAFVGKTGDLQAGRDAIGQLAKLSQATGSNIGDMADAAGDVVLQLGDIDNKGQRAFQVMRTFAGQGKLGAVEIKNLAADMGRLASAASSYEGGANANIEKLGVIAQLARQYGGATSAKQAVNAVSSFTNDVAKKHGLLEANGIGVLSGDGKSLRDPLAILNDIVDKTKGSVVKRKELLKNILGERPATAVDTIYNEAANKAKAAGGGADAQHAKGKEAVNAKFTELLKAGLSDKELRDSLAARMGDPDVKAQLTNNKLDDMGDRLFGKLGPVINASLPAFEQLGMSAIDLAGKLGPLAQTAASTVGALAAWHPEIQLGAILGEKLGAALGGKAGAALQVGFASFQITSAVVTMIANDVDQGKSAAVGDDLRRSNADSAERMAEITQKRADRIAEQHGKDSAEAKQAQSEADATAAEAKKQRAEQAKADSNLESKKKDLAGYGGTGIGSAWGLFPAIDSALGIEGGVSFKDQSEIANQSGADAAYSKGTAEFARNEKIFKYIQGGGEVSGAAIQQFAGPNASIAEMLSTANALKDAAAALKESASHLTNSAGSGGKGIDPAGRTPG